MNGQLNDGVLQKAAEVKKLKMKPKDAYTNWQSMMRHKLALE